MRAVIEEFCANIGKDSLLVQGAGGNVSWKDSDTLWVKASGTGLAEAGIKDIFVPVDLAHLQSEIKNNNFAVTPKVLAGAKLRPSIETLLHALLPHKVVVHLHAVDIMAYLVRENGVSEIAGKLAGEINFIAVDYFKPGEELARAISNELSKSANADVVFLQNHGVVIGGDDIAQVARILSLLIKKLAVAPKSQAGNIQELALDERLFERVISAWALYPDHVVFLGAEPVCYDSMPEMLPADELVFVRGDAVIMKDSFSKAKYEQLRCYYDILVRQPDNAKLCILTRNQIGELLNWEAEKYRQSLEKR